MNFYALGRPLEDVFIGTRSTVQTVSVVYFTSDHVQLQYSLDGATELIQISAGNNLTGELCTSSDELLR